MLFPYIYSHYFYDFYNNIYHLSTKKMSAEVLSQQYSGYLTSLRKLNTQYIQRLSEDTKKSFSEKIKKIKILEGQNNSQEQSFLERVKKLQLTEGTVKKLLEFNQKLIYQVLQSSQDYEVKREKIKALQQENDDQVNDYYQRVARYRPTTSEQNSVAIRSYSAPRGVNFSDAEFVRTIHKGRLIRGVFIGMNPSEYHVFFLRENVPPLIVIDDLSVKSVEITYPDKASTKISVTQFESSEQKEFFKKDSYTGSVNFSANFSANSLFYSVNVGASAEYTKETDFTGATQSERKFYSLNRSNLVSKRNITFNKRELVFQNAFKSKIRELEGVYKTCNGNVNELKKLNQRIFKEVYEEYGTHFNIGAYYVGGRFDYSAQTKYDADSDRKQAREAVSYKVHVEARAKAFGMQGGFSFGIQNNNSSQTSQQIKTSKFQLREETNMKGGSGASVEDFMDGMNYNSDWVVLGQSKIQSSYVPMWEIVQKSITDLNTGFYRELQNSYIRFLKYKLDTYQKWLVKYVREGLDDQVLNQEIWKTNGTGFGEFFFKDLRKYIGNLLNREPHGIGAIYDNEKVAIIGTWKKGVLTEGYQFRSKSWYSFTRVPQEQIVNQTVALSLSLSDWISLRDIQIKLFKNQAYTLGHHVDNNKQLIFIPQYSQDKVNKSLKLTNMVDKHYNNFVNCYGIGEQETVSYNFVFQTSINKDLTIAIGPKAMFKNFRWGSMEGFVYDTKRKNIYNGPSLKQVTKTIDSQVTIRIQRTLSEFTILIYANNQASAFFSQKLYSAHSNALLYMMFTLYDISDRIRIDEPF